MQLQRCLGLFSSRHLNESDPLGISIVIFENGTVQNGPIALHHEKGKTEVFNEPSLLMLHSCIHLPKSSMPRARTCMGGFTIADYAAAKFALKTPQFRFTHVALVFSPYLRDIQYFDCRKYCHSTVTML